MKIASMIDHSTKPPMNGENGNADDRNSGMKEGSGGILGERTPNEIEAEIERRLTAGESPDSIRYDHRGCGCDRPIDA